MMMMIMIIAINVKHEVYKTVIGDVVAHQKPQKNYRFVRFVMYCSITTVPYHSTEHVVMEQYITNLTKR